MSRPEVLVIGCGALARELAALTGDLPGVEVALLPALLHNRPDGIPGAVADRIREARASGRYARILVAYADCGTGGALDRVCEEAGVERLPGAHCYEVFAGREVFAALHAEEPGTFYLTDFLVRAFEALVWRGLGLDRHPELRDVYFANYRRVVYLAQQPDAALVARARAAAERLGLAFELRETGLGELRPAVEAFAGRSGGAADPGLARDARLEAGSGAWAAAPVGSVHGVHRRDPKARRRGSYAGRPVDLVHDVQATDGPAGPAPRSLHAVQGHPAGLHGMQALDADLHDMQAARAPDRRRAARPADRRPADRRPVDRRRAAHRAGHRADHPAADPAGPPRPSGQAA